MKKLLLFLTILMGASGWAQLRTDALGFLGMTTDEVIANGDMTNTAPNGPQRDPQIGLAYYYRPAGAFYQGVSADTATWTPALVVRPYSTVTYKAREARSYEWTYQQGGNWYTTTGNQNLEVTYGCEIDSVPKLKTGVGNTYNMFGWEPVGLNCDLALDHFKKSRLEVHAIPDPKIIHPKSNLPLSDASPFLMSPKFWGASERDGTYGSLGAWYPLLEDESWHGEYFYQGQWYNSDITGRNRSGLDSLSLWCEKPSTPYMLRGIGILYRNLLIPEGEATLDIVIRKAEKDYETDDVTPGEVLAITSRNIDKNDEIWIEAVKDITDSLGVNEQGDDCKFWHFDTVQTWQTTNRWYIPLPEPLIIDSEIMITLTGYNNENVLDFELFPSLDRWDEGYGNHGYVYDSNEGRYLPISEEIIRNPNIPFYSNTTPSIFMDVKFPYTMLRDADDTGVRQVGAAGGKVAVALKSSDPGSEQQVTIESATPGSDDVSWLTVGFTDGETSELGEHSLTANLDVAPNTAGTPRSARVTITMPASPTVTLIVNQTDGMVGDVTGDGQVDIADVNAVINIMLGKGGLTPDPSPGGEGSPADVTGDGEVDIADVNAIINIMLGK